MKTVNSIISAVTITFAIVFSCRIVMVATPLNPAEQVAMVCMAIEYTMLKSKRMQEKEDDT